MKRKPYSTLTPDERQEILTVLLEDWTRDWDDRLGIAKDGSMVWQVNAVDLMLLVDEIYRLRLAAAMQP